MKKILSLIMALALMLSLSACSEKQPNVSNTESNTDSISGLTKKDFYGTWINIDTNEFLVIDEFNISLCDSRKQPIHGYTWELAKINGNTVSIMDDFTFTLTDVNSEPQLIGELGTFITEKAAQEMTVHVGLNETAKGKFFEVTAKEYEFAELLGEDNTTGLFLRDIGWSNAGDGKVFMIIKFDYTNLAKQEVDMVRDMQVSVLYRDGYEFNSFKEENAYIFEDDINGAFRKCWLDAGGYVMEMSPLSSGSFFVAIPVAEMVSTDTESSIQIRFDYGKNIKGGGELSETIFIDVQ